MWFRYYVLAAELDLVDHIMYGTTWTEGGRRGTGYRDGHQVVRVGGGGGGVINEGGVDISWRGADHFEGT